MNLSPETIERRENKGEGGRTTKHSLANVLASVSVLINVSYMSGVVVNEGLLLILLFQGLNILCHLYVCSVAFGIYEYIVDLSEVRCIFGIFYVSSLLVSRHAYVCTRNIRVLDFHATPRADFRSTGAAITILQRGNICTKCCAFFCPFIIRSDNELLLRRREKH